MTETDKVRENRLRRVAERQGLTLRKSRRRDPHALDYGAYWLSDANNALVTHEGGSSLDQIEEFLQAGAPRVRPGRES